jgi:hypothetical protein
MWWIGTTHHYIWHWHSVTMLTHFGHIFNFLQIVHYGLSFFHITIVTFWTQPCSHFSTVYMKHDFILTENYVLIYLCTSKYYIYIYIYIHEQGQMFVLYTWMGSEKSVLKRSLCSRFNELPKSNFRTSGPHRTFVLEIKGAWLG